MHLRKERKIDKFSTPKSDSQAKRDFSEKITESFNSIFDDISKTLNLHNGK